jgi:hypothetical protein
MVARTIWAGYWLAALVISGPSIQATLHRTASFDLTTPGRMQMSKPIRLVPYAAQAIEFSCQLCDGFHPAYVFGTSQFRILSVRGLRPDGLDRAEEGGGLSLIGTGQGE